MSLFGCFSTSFTFLVFFIVSFGSRGSGSSQKMSSNYIKNPFFTLCKGAADSEKRGKQLFYHCFNSNSFTTPYNVWITTFSTLSFNKLRTGFGAILLHSPIRFSVSSCFTLFDKPICHQRLQKVRMRDEKGQEVTREPWLSCNVGEIVISASIMYQQNTDLEPSIISLSLVDGWKGPKSSTNRCGTISQTF